MLNNLQGYHAAMERRTQKQVSVGIASELLQVFWTDFIEKSGCVFAAFHGGRSPAPSGTKTDWECFVNHTYVMDEFLNNATFQRRENISKELDEIEEIYDESHHDFAIACELGKTMARMWAIKLKADFPNEQFRVYYAQYDNPIVRFHKVRPDEHVWLTDKALLDAEDSSFRDALIYDTEYLGAPVVKK